jgi:hypothetical protein
MTRNLPAFLHDLINSTPRAGEGVHTWLFRVARQLHAHLPASDIVRLLASQVAQCGRNVPRSENVSAVQNALPYAWQPSSKAAPTQTVRKWPPANQEQCEAILRDGCGLADLWEASPVRIEDSEAHTEEIVDRLFPPDALLCCGKSNSAFDTRPRESWRGELSQLALIVPSPMAAPTGLTKEGKESAHSLSNTGPRRFLVVEFDQGTADDHAALLLHLARYAPMVCALHSGGKSMHGWFLVNGQPGDKVARFFHYAVSLGADPRMWAPCQFARMPDGTRDTGKRQTVYFLSYKPLEAAR